MNSASFSTVNPATGEQIETFPFFTARETEAALVRAEKSFNSYRKLCVHRRAQLLSQLAATLRRNKAQLAKVITTEMGKILSEAEVEKCAREADWYAEHEPQMLADEPAPTGNVDAYVSYLILGIMPWNFPPWQATRMGIPTLLAGNVLLIKHSPNTQRSSLELERVMLEAGLPEGVFQNLILKTEDIVNVINDGRVQGASVTGSVRAGSAVASEAGKVIKKTVMELGGSDAFIVLEDADIPEGSCGGYQRTVQQRGSDLPGCKTVHPGREYRRRV
jgi:succinate-semialdehyde dehydrogenase